MLMEKILVSACLLGELVRYDAQSKKLEEEIISNWQKEDRIISVCPEVIGGLAVPRHPAEIISTNQDIHVKNSQGKDVTDAFKKGANTALKLVKRHHIKIAILKEGSPSCGSSYIYDGTFTGSQISGEGLTTSLLREHGVLVFSEHQIDAANNALKKLSHA